MNAQRLLALYERIADAPDAVGRLRRFVLDLAVRGKLVAQDDRDDLVSDLILRISEVRELQEQNGRRKSNREDVSRRCPPFNVPAAWKWVFLGKVARIRTGKLDANAAVKDGRYPFFTCSQTPSAIDSYSFDTAAVLLAGNGDFNLKSYAGKFDAYQRTYVIEPANWLLAYCFIVIRSQIDRITDNQRGSAIPYLKLADIADLFIPLPPLAEQHRIVAKVDELMALCDRLEAARAQREATRDRLAAASLARLNAPAPDTFRDDARFALDALPALTTRPDQIKQLRQTILNLAVRGKLVAQDSHDGTGQELREQLTASPVTARGKRRLKGRVDPSVADDERYLEVPASWAWMRLMEMGQTQTGSTPSSTDEGMYGSCMPFVKPSDLDGIVINYDGAGLSEAGAGRSRIIPENSVLMVCIGATLGKVNFTTRAVCCNQQINALTPALASTTPFVTLALKAPPFQELCWSKAGTGTLPIISKGKWEILPIPLPPLAEQQRIVAKVDELMALCDQLEASLVQGDTARRHLLDALLAEALAPATTVDEGEPALT